MADEVRNLSKRVQKVTEEVQSNITDIDGSARDVGRPGFLRQGRDSTIPAPILHRTQLHGILEKTA